MSQPHRLILHQLHESLGAEFVPFAGWLLPAQYVGQAEEHLHTRSACSVFDVSYIGRLRVLGPDREALLDRCLASCAAGFPEGQARRALFCREDGSALDWPILARLPQAFLIVCSPHRRVELLAALQQHSEGLDVELRDETARTAMAAIEGPDALPLLAESLGDVLPVPVEELTPGCALTGTYTFVPFTLVCVGLADEPGFLIVLPPFAARMAWDYLCTKELEGGRKVSPAGLSARESLRVEAGVPAAECEISSDVDPFTLGLEEFVDLEKPAFPGKQALANLHARGPAHRLVGIEMDGTDPPTVEAPVCESGRPVGRITSAVFSPSLRRNIALALVDGSLADAAAGQAVSVRIGDADATGRIVTLPFPHRRG